MHITEINLHFDKMNIRDVNKSLIHNYKKGIHW